MKVVPVVFTAIIAALLSALGNVWYMVACYSVPCLVVSMVVLTWTECGPPGRAYRPGYRPRRLYLAIAANLAFHLSVLTTSWPLRLSFHLSEPELRQLAGRVREGEPITFPRYAGAFRIEQGAGYPDTVFLWTALDPSGNTGFQVGWDGTYPRSPSYPWFEMRLSRAWRLIIED